eukprot:1988668-Rhodomonas_salina.1
MGDARYGAALRRYARGRLQCWSSLGATPSHIRIGAYRAYLSGVNARYIRIAAYSRAYLSGVTASCVRIAAYSRAYLSGVTSPSSDITSPLPARRTPRPDQRVAAFVAGIPAS